MRRAIFVLMVFGLGCQDLSFREPSEQKTSLGEAIFALVRTQLERGDCAEARLRIWDAQRADVVWSLDAVLSEDLREGLAPFVKSAVIPLVDTGALPKLTGRLGASLSELDEDSLDAILSLTQKPTVLPARHLEGLVGRSLSTPDAQRVAIDLLRLAQVEPELLRSGSRLLDLALSPSEDGPECPSLPGLDLEQTLLRQTELVAAGPPAYAVRANPDGSPRAATANGDPSVAPFSTEGRRDAYTRAVLDDGALAYAYFDVKATPLAHAVTFASGALEENVHHDVGRLFSVLAGGDKEALFDLSASIFELARIDALSTFAITSADLLHDDPDLSKRALKSAVAAVKEIDNAGVDLFDPALLVDLDESLPLVSELLTDKCCSTSAARDYLDVIDRLGRTERDFPEKLKTTIVHTELIKEDACSETAPDLSASPKVDFSKPRFMSATTGMVDNRSAFERSVELLAHSGQCRIPLLDKSIAELLIESMASMEPDGVCRLIELTLGIADIPFSEDLGAGALDVIGCEGEQIFADLTALDALAKSGALDAYLPLARIVVDTERVPTLIALTTRLAEDLGRDDDGDPSTQSMLRRMEPTLGKLLTHPVTDPLFDVVHQLAVAPASNGSGTALLLLADVVATLLDDTQPLTTKDGVIWGRSHLQQLIRSATGVVEIIDQSQERSTVHRLLDLALAPIEDDDPRVWIVLTAVADLASQAIDVPASDRACWIAQVQGRLDRLLASSDLETLGQGLLALEGFKEGRTVDAALLSLLSPAAGVTIGADLYGGFLQVLGGALSAPLDQGALSALVTDLGPSLDAPKSQESLLSTLSIIESLLVHDTEGALMSIATSALDQGPNADRDSAATVLAGVISDLASFEKSRQCVPRTGPLTREELDALVRDAADYLSKDEEGLSAVYELIRLRKGAPR